MPKKESDNHPAETQQPSTISDGSTDIWAEIDEINDPLSAIENLFKQDRELGTAALSAANRKGVMSKQDFLAGAAFANIFQIIRDELNNQDKK